MASTSRLSEGSSKVAKGKRVVKKGKGGGKGTIVQLRLKKGSALERAALKRAGVTQAKFTKLKEDRFAKRKANKAMGSFSKAREQSLGQAASVRTKTQAQKDAANKAARMKLKNEGKAQPSYAPTPAQNPMTRGW